MTDLIHEFTIFLGLIFLVKNLLFLLRQLRFINMFIVGERELVFIQATLLQTGLGYQLKYQLRRRLLVITHLHRLEKLALKIKNI